MAPNDCTYKTRLSVYRPLRQFRSSIIWKLNPVRSRLRDPLDVTDDKGKAMRRTLVIFPYVHWNIHHGWKYVQQSSPDQAIPLDHRSKSISLVGSLPGNNHHQLILSHIPANGSGEQANNTQHSRHQIPQIFQRNPLLYLYHQRCRPSGAEIFHSSCQKSSPRSRWQSNGWLLVQERPIPPSSTPQFLHQIQSWLPHHDFPIRCRSSSNRASISKLFSSRECFEDGSAIIIMSLAVRGLTSFYMNFLVFEVFEVFDDLRCCWWLRKCGDVWWWGLENWKGIFVSDGVSNMAVIGVWKFIRFMLEMSEGACLLGVFSISEGSLWERGNYDIGEVVAFSIMLESVRIWVGDGRVLNRWVLILILES